MLNIREVIRRTLKYLVLVIIVGFSAHSVPKFKNGKQRIIINFINCGNDILYY